MPNWLNFDKFQLKISGIPNMSDILQENNSFFGKIFNFKLKAFNENFQEINFNNSIDFSIEIAN